MKKLDEIKKGKNRVLLSGLIKMLMESKKYWMIPIILALLLFGLITIFGSSTVAPFIYTLF